MRSQPAELLVILRIKKNWRQADVAEKAELSPAVIGATRAA
jgi:transcriptional regulator with XRE-family HTH domain